MRAAKPRIPEPLKLWRWRLVVPASRSPMLVTMSKSEAKVSVAALQGRRTANQQACDLQLWCAVRELNHQPADSDYSVVGSRAWLWKPLHRNEFRDSDHWTSVVNCRCLWLKDVAKSVLSLRPEPRATTSPTGVEHARAALSVPMDR